MADLPTDPKLELFLTRDQIHERVQEMGAEISRDFAGQPLLIIGVLKGASMFVADLARAITLDCELDFISVASYGAQQHSSGKVRLLSGPEAAIGNRNVLLVEDIIDTGITLASLREILLAQKPAAFKIAALLDKPSRRVKAAAADYIGFTIPDRFVVGYGMDAAGYYRNLPDLYFMPEASNRSNLHLG